ncbi:unnamed protein product [Ambrosiozyma monospora]|uniref:Unnamed protein product n=1 Tax=Ambrosiozyma monospora TaxID=43982 RepID=A0A9W7DFI6_AMBMO|nr:unnamed protein product [Ambrosiozyma monospora]
MLHNPSESQPKAMPKYIVTLKLSPRILSQFPNLTNVPTTKLSHHKIKKIKLKHNYEPNESSPLANPKAINTASSQLLETANSDSNKSISESTTSGKRRSASGEIPATATTTRSILNPPSSPIQHESSSRSSTPLLVSSKSNNNNNNNSTSNNGGGNGNSGGNGNNSTSGYSGSSLRIGGLTMNSNSNAVLDKSGTPCKKWIKNTGAHGRLVRSFSGYNMHFGMWMGLEESRKRIQDEELKKEQNDKEGSKDKEGKTEINKKDAKSETTTDHTSGTSLFVKIEAPV